MLPAPAKQFAADAWSAWTARGVVREIEQISRGGKPIIIGPWLGEVGFELLYWVPFVAWAVERFTLAPERLLVVSRGGTGDWYRHFASTYRDAFAFVSEDEFRARNRQRSEELGEQKQVRLTAFEADLVSLVARASGLGDVAVLHPSLMYRAFNPYWWGYQDERWVRAHASFQTLPRPSLERLPGLPERYVAVKFYFNDAFPATTENRATAARVVRELSCEGPVVSLATGLRIDDHRGWEEEEQHAVRGIRANLDIASNLGVQSAIVAGATAWAGTYGGFAYLAPFHGIPARAYYSNPGGFSRRHLALAESVFDGFAPGLLDLHDVRNQPRMAAAR